MKATVFKLLTALDVAVPAQNFLRCTFSINRIALSIVGAWFLPFEILHIFYRLTKINKSSNFNFNPVLFKNIPTFHLQVLQGTSPLQHHKNKLDQNIISNPPSKCNDFKHPQKQKKEMTNHLPKPAKKKLPKTSTQQCNNHQKNTHTKASTTLAPFHRHLSRSWPRVHKPWLLPPERRCAILPRPSA